jgi:hypothetical protein
MQSPHGNTNRVGASQTHRPENGRYEFKYETHIFVLGLAVLHLRHIRCTDREIQILMETPDDAEL